MKESLIGSVVNTVTGTVESTTNALTGATTSTDTESSDSPATSAPASTTATPKRTTATPAVTTTSAPASTTATPASTTSAPAATTSTPSSTTSSPSASTAAPTSDSSSASSDSDTTSSPIASTQAPAASSSTAAPSTTDIASNDDTGVSVSSDSGSSAAHLRGSQDHSYNIVVVGSQSGSSSSQGDGEAGVTDDTTADAGVSIVTVVGLVLGSLGALLLIVLLVSWCLKRRRRLRMSSIGHVRLGATGNIPVFNTQGTERFETSSTSVSFSPFHTAKADGATSGGTGRSGLWDDEVITAMRIPMEKLTTTALLSSGGYGEVYRGLYREEPVAVKVLLPEKQKNLGQINAFLAEIKMMATIDHPCIVRFHGVAWDSLSDLSAVMEFMEGGDLRSLLDRFEQEQRPRGFDLDKARIALQTAQALTYLHSLDPKVLHRDLKSRNILLSPELDAKLSDFGVARKYTFSSMTAGVGTSLWMAPEVMLGDRYDASADIFSFGVVLSELDSHVHPYAEARMTNSGQRVPDAALLQLVAMGRVSVEFSVNAPTMLADLGRACVRLNPTTRPSASEVHYQLQLLLQSFELYTV